MLAKVPLRQRTHLQAMSPQAVIVSLEACQHVPMASQCSNVLCGAMLRDTRVLCSGIYWYGSIPDHDGTIGLSRVSLHRTYRYRRYRLTVRHVASLSITSFSRWRTQAASIVFEWTRTDGCIG
jgi:hypothetical protein